MKILSYCAGYATDHSESDYQYVTRMQREGQSRRFTRGEAEKSLHVNEEELAVLLLGANVLQDLERMGGVLVERKTLSELVGKLVRELDEGSLVEIESEAEEIVEWLDDVEIETDPAYFSDFGWMEAPRYSTRETKPLVLQALQERRRLIINYYTASTGEMNRRKIDPLSLDGDMLTAYCHLRQAERVFKLSRIESAQLTDERF
jgi:predicted DNA-binding transcriptional regulator YafY